MKKFFGRMAAPEKISVSFTKNALYAVAFCAATLMLYSIVVKSRGALSLRHAELLKNSLEYVAASLSLGICFGLLIDLAVKENIIQKSGAWFNYGEIKIGQGRENAKRFLEENIEIFNEVEGKVREIYLPEKMDDGEEI